MLHFIPAWYQQNQWCENEQSWRVRRMHTEFDDTVKQIQLFHRNHVYAYQILLLSFAPNFRHFLHRQGVFHAPYWSCFDAIQEVRRKKAAVLSIHNLKWPAGIEFVYTPFVVVAFYKNQKYAQIDFGEDGNPIRIDLYKEGRISRQNIYDDRGFVSSTVLYREGKPLYRDYLKENGTWKLRHFQEDGHVEINPGCPEYMLMYQGKEQKVQFSKLLYENLENVIHEVMLSYLNLTAEQDIFCVAMHDRHVCILKEVLKKKKTILSFYTERYSVTAHPEALEMMEDADYIIVDSEKNMNQIRRESTIHIQNIVAIPPFDSRMDFGISQQLSVQKILIPVDGMQKEEFGELIRLLGAYLPENREARIHLFTRKAEYDRRQKMLESVRNQLREAGMEEGWAAEEKDTIVAENNLELDEKVAVRFYVEQCVDELAVSKCMREQRVLLDLRKNPELYLQITALSFGIPQIVRERTEFVEHGKNGIILKDMTKLSAALKYYLDGLKNWNAARVSSYELGKAYTTERLLEMWGEVVKSVG